MSKKNRIVVEILDRNGLIVVHADRDPGDLFVIDHNKISSGEDHIDHYVPDCRPAKVDQVIDGAMKEIRRQKRLRKEKAS